MAANLACVKINGQVDERRGRKRSEGTRPSFAVGDGGTSNCLTSAGLWPAKRAAVSRSCLIEGPACVNAVSSRQGQTRRPCARPGCGRPGALRNDAGGVREGCGVRMLICWRLRHVRRGEYRTLLDGGGLRDRRAAGVGGWAGWSDTFDIS